MSVKKEKGWDVRISELREKLLERGSTPEEIRKKEEAWALLKVDLQNKLKKRGFTQEQVERMEFVPKMSRKGKPIVHVIWEIGYSTKDHYGNTIFSLPDTGSDR